MSKPKFVATVVRKIDGVETLVKVDITSQVEDVVDDINKVQCRRGMMLDENGNLIQIFPDALDDENEIVERIYPKPSAL